MATKIIIVNTGSTSKKYGYFLDDELVLTAHFEEDRGALVVTVEAKDIKKTVSVTKEEFFDSFKYFLNALISQGYIMSKEDLSAVGIRVVAPGTVFAKDQVIQEKYLDLLEKTRLADPVHIDPLIDELEIIIEEVSKHVPLVAVSDSAFHSTIPEIAKIYAIPHEITKKEDLYRFGYHGLSVESASKRVVKVLGMKPKKMIVCHLGGGSSVTALLNGKSIDTSMGFSPLEGVPMATRSGSIDPGVLIRIAQIKKMNPEEARHFLYTECGVKGVSGISSDTRVLIEKEEKGDEDAKLALDLYAYSIKKYIGAYMTILGGCDAVVITGTIGERSFVVREKIFLGLENMGIKIDKRINKSVTEGNIRISSLDSKIPVVVLKNGEYDELYSHTYKFIK